MREKNVLPLLLWLNVALAGWFVGYILISSSSQPRVTPTSFKPLSTSTSNLASFSTNASLTNLDGALEATNALAEATHAVVSTNQAAPQPVFTAKKIGWE